MMQFPEVNLKDWLKVCLWYSPFFMVFVMMTTGRVPYASFQYGFAAGDPIAAGVCETHATSGHARARQCPLGLCGGRR